MKHKFQISESIRLGAILALSGGFMDAYSYMERGEVLPMHRLETCFSLGYISLRETSRTH